MEGSFNPYGNGQPMSKQQWIKINAKNLKGASPNEVNVKYKKYVAKMNRTTTRVAKAMASNPEPIVQQKRKPQKMRETGLDKRADVRLSGCARNYAACLRCPFWWRDQSCDAKLKSLKVTDENPCIPSFPAIKTRKFFAVSTGFFGSTDGNPPFIMFAPHRLANTGNVDNVSPPILTSTTTGSNTFPVVDTAAAVIPGCVTSWLNTEYTQAALVNGINTRGVRFRVVGGGIRVKYTGNIQNASGMYLCVEHPNHLSLSQLTTVDASKFDSYFTMSVSNSITNNRSGGWVYLTYTPVDIDDFEFLADPIANNLWPNDAIRNHFIGILVPGAPNGSQLFEWEAIIHYEVIGINVTGKTLTPADPIGLATVVNSVSPEQQKSLNTEEPVKAAVKEGASSLTSFVTTTGPKLMEKVVTDILPSVLPP